MRISNKLNTFVNSLRPSINALCSTAVTIKTTIKTIGNLVSNGNIPQGYTPVCRLGITNPPVTLTRNWNESLRECGRQLNAILINHHSECHQNMLKDIKLTINTEFQSITNEFQATVLELQSKLKFMENEITQLIETTEQQLLNQRNRNSNNLDDSGKPANKKPRNPEENSNNPSSATTTEQGLRQRPQKRPWRSRRSSQIFLITPVKRKLNARKRRRIAKKHYLSFSHSLYICAIKIVLPVLNTLSWTSPDTYCQHRRNSCSARDYHLSLQQEMLTISRSYLTSTNLLENFVTKSTNPSSAPTRMDSTCSKKQHNQISNPYLQNIFTLKVHLNTWRLN